MSERLEQSKNQLDPAMLANIRNKLGELKEYYEAMLEYNEHPEKVDALMERVPALKQMILEASSKRRSLKNREVMAVKARKYLKLKAKVGGKMLDHYSRCDIGKVSVALDSINQILQTADLSLTEMRYLMHSMLTSWNRWCIDEDLKEAIIMPDDFEVTPQTITR